MKIAVIILVILGILASLGLGIYWVTEYNDNKELISDLSSTADDLGVDIKSELNTVEKQKNSGYALIAGGIVSLLALILIGKLKKISALIFLLSAIVPAILYPGSLIFTFLLVIGGILAFFIKPKTQTAQVTAA